MLVQSRVKRIGWPDNFHDILAFTASNLQHFSNDSVIWNLIFCSTFKASGTHIVSPTVLIIELGTRWHQGGETGSTGVPPTLSRTKFLTKLFQNVNTSGIWLQTDLYNVYTKPMTFALFMLAIFSVPLAGIISKTYLRKLELQTRSSPELENQVKTLLLENADMRERIETLETIATTSSGLEPQSDAEILERMEALATVSRR